MKSNTNSVPKILSRSELAKILGVHSVTLITYEKEGLLKPIKIKRLVYYYESDIAQLLKENSIK